MKKKTVIRAVIAFIVFVAAARLLWTVLIPPPVFCVDKVQSPDKRYTAKALNIWYNDYWGKAPHENHYFSIQTADGQTIQRVHADKAWTGWPHDLEYNGPQIVRPSLLHSIPTIHFHRIWCLLLIRPLDSTPEACVYFLAFASCLRAFAPLREVSPFSLCLLNFHPRL